MTTTIEPQYQVEVDLRDKQGRASLGVLSGFTWQNDPRRLGFCLSRYKFVAKMLSGKHHVLEVGCGDAFYSRVVKQEVDDLTATDMDALFIEDAIQRGVLAEDGMELRVHNMLDGPVNKSFNAAYALDVIEHIPSTQTDTFLTNISKSLRASGVLIIGSPSLNSQMYASEGSRIGHVNCMEGGQLKMVMDKHFINTFMFSMNDEVLHTGFMGMSHYLFAVGVGVRL